MDGDFFMENHGKPHFFMDDFGESSPLKLSIVVPVGFEDAA